MKVAVVTDSTADVDDTEAERLGVHVLPLIVRFGSESFRDKVDLTLPDFYRKLVEERGLPATSQPPIGEFVELYERLLQQCDSIISVHLGSRFSGTFDTAATAARTVSPNRIRVVDSGAVAYPLGALALRLARLAAAGGTVNECLALAEEVKPRLRLYAILDTVEYLRRGGRIGRVEAMAGALLSIKPIVLVRDNELIPVERVRTRAAAIRRAQEFLKALGPVEEVAILHADDPEPADHLMEAAKSFWPDIDLKRGTIGPVIGTHTGPGPFGFAAVLAA